MTANSNSAIHLPDDSEIAANEQPLAQVDILIGQLTLSRGITAAYAVMYQRALERLAERDRELAELRVHARNLKLAASNTMLELTALLERALQAALGAPSLDAARATYAAVEADLQATPETLDDLERAANARLEIEVGDTTTHVVESGGAL